MAGSGFGKIYITTAIINAVSSAVNGHLSRKQQKALAEQNQQFTLQMEENRQNFQLQVNRENMKTQRELNEFNHEMRLEEQKNNFELMCRGAEWQHFLNDWPLRVQPSVLRQEQILADGTVALRVFFAKSSNKLFSSYIYPQVEQGLLEFVDNYHNIFHSYNIIFYHNAYKDNAYGGAINTNIRYALKELPVIIIDSNVLLDEICVSATIWGFGNGNEQHSTIFKLPYKIEGDDGTVNKKYVKDLTNQLLAYLKYVLGYAYDTYNLVMYNRAPILPQVAALELENHIESAPLRYKGIQTAISEEYSKNGEIYSAILQIGTEDREEGFAEKPESFKKTILHVLRLEYAKSVKALLTPDDYENILNESVEAWCRLRTTESSETFIRSLLQDPGQIQKYFAPEDLKYFDDLCDCYLTLKERGTLGKDCIQLRYFADKSEKKLTEAAAAYALQVPQRVVKREDVACADDHPKKKKRINL